MLKPSVHHSPQRVHVIVLGQISFIQKIKENTSLRREDMQTQKMRRGERENEHVSGRERPLALWLLFLYVFSSPGPALCKLGQPGMLFVLPQVLTPVLGPSFVLFSQAFPFLVFQPPPFWTPFSYSNFWQSLFFHLTDEKPESQRAKVDRLKALTLRYFSQGSLTQCPEEV